MRRTIPYNHVAHDYEKVLGEFVSQLKGTLGDFLMMVYLTGSYARGDATDKSDMDIFCIFDNVNRHVLETVGFCARHTSVAYDVLEINVQCMSVREYKSKYFEDWSEYAVTELNSVILYGEELFHIEDIKAALTVSYKKSLADVIMSARHYLCVDEPKEKLTHEKISTYILKPLMFALRQERFCTKGVYPLSVKDLLNSYSDENRILVEYFMDRAKFENDIAEDHKQVLARIHGLIERMLDI